MKLSELLAAVDEIKPNAFSPAAKTTWINEAEGYVQTDIFLLAPAETRQYVWPEDAETELLAAAPHHKLYWAYLSAMIDFANGEYGKYQNSMQLYNAFLGEYMRWYARHIHPADGGAVQQGYYLSAYGIAVQHGFVGTEEEWLLALKGDAGDSPLLRYDPAAQRLEWSLGDSGEWQPLLELEELRGSVVAATLAQLQQAADTAGQQCRAAEDAADAAAESARQADSARAAAVQAAETAQQENRRNERQNARLANLEAAALGKLYREQVDDSAAYVKPVPAGALPYAAVTEVESVELDGVTYRPTAVLVHGVNWLPSSVELRSGAINTDTGKMQTSSANVYTYNWVDVVRLRGKQITYSFTSTSTAAIGVAFYTSKNNDSFISGKAIKNGATVVVPSNANYARFTFRGSDAQPTVVLGDSLPEVRVPWREPDRYDIDSLPVYVAVKPGESISIENDMGVPVPMPSSVTYAINVQEAIANE